MYYDQCLCYNDRLRFSQQHMYHAFKFLEPTQFLMTFICANALSRACCCYYLTLGRRTLPHFLARMTIHFPDTLAAD